MTSRERLERLLGGDELAVLRRRLRRRYELGVASGNLHLARLSPVERAALARLLGLPQSDATSMRVALTALDDVMRRAQLADSLRSALEILDGPICDRAALHAAGQERWSSVREAACAGPLGGLLAEAKGMGLLKRMAGGDPRRAAHLCELAQRVLLRLPANGVPRAQVAAEVLGDAHGLDPGRPVATLVLAQLRRARADNVRERTSDSTVDDAQDSDGVRNVWASVGVLLNELARPALFLNLLAQDRAFIPGEPGYLSLRTLLRTPPRWDVSGKAVFVCENPNFVAIAAEALGTACAPLVCTDGMPAAAQRVLLAQLAVAGAHLCYHGDFDWAGIGVGNVVMREFNAQPWRYRAQDYLLALSRAAAHERACELGAGAVDASWDAELIGAMQNGGWAVHEEAIADLLLPDLSIDGNIGTGQIQRDSP